MWLLCLRGVLQWNHLSDLTVVDHAMAMWASSVLTLVHDDDYDYWPVLKRIDRGCVTVFHLPTEPNIADQVHAKARLPPSYNELI
jgi:hypothetical protein